MVQKKRQSDVPTDRDAEEPDVIEPPVPEQKKPDVIEPPFGKKGAPTKPKQIK